MRTPRLGALAGAVVLGAGLLAVSGPAISQEVPEAAPVSDVTPAAESTGDTIVHLFQWNWDSVAAECADFLGPNGYGGVQVSPPQEHVVVPSSEGGEYPWWQDYQPVSYSIENTRRGTAEEFENMVDTCADNGVRIYVDAVINHMTGPSEADLPGSAGTEWEQYEYPDLFGDGEASYSYDDFGPCYDTIENWDDKDEVQNCQLLDLADLDTGSDHVRAQIVRYLNGLVDMGVGGFRVDASKHVPEEDMGAIIGSLNEVPGFGGAPHVYHEVIGDATVPYTAYTPYGQVTNFDYQRDIASSFADGDIANLTSMPDHGGLTSDEAVVFIDNHDTQRYEPALTYVDGDRYYLATAFMLAHPYGTPVVMSSYDFQGNEAEGPPSVGEVDGDPAGRITADSDCASGEWICEHRNETVGGMVAFRNAVEGAELVERAEDGSSRVAFDRGDVGFAAFNASGESWSLTAATSLPDGEYDNVAGSGGATVSGGEVTATVPAEGALALHMGGECVQDCDGGDPGDPDEPGDPDTITATVETEPGQEVHVIGSTPELGSWEPADGVALSTDADTYPRWTGTVTIEADTEWKLVKVGPDGSAEWEPGDNRVGPSTSVSWGQT
ncbi:MAG TPA: alpha amylase C-terminal domain-containing protein [Nocardiopsis listeri]|uniref:carbohydrate-binding module family 20 domain-containing protein n=1 Tax=Nocardiopsis listeri TaxID=53440 RepID=UPI001E0725C5|nr:carbohydrate-binding module family 20 domain-containing protein [Nocardiopsis listeri]HJE57154.1 alpha amylase C-terminal domain-containing protein [Nocardiopsis listeri]